MPDLQKIAPWIISIVTVLIIVLAAYFLINMQTSTLTVPSLSASTDINVQNAKEQEIENYKTLVTVINDQKKDAYDYIVLKTLLQIFETLVGIVLGYFVLMEFTSTWKNHLELKRQRKEA